MTAHGHLRRGPAHWVAIIVPLLCLVLTPVLGGCDILFFMFGDLEETEQEQARDTASEWQRAHDQQMTNEDGSVNVSGVATAAKRAITGSTGDPEADAALSSDSAIAHIIQADEAEQRGWQTNDSRAFDEAVKLRPNDWKYRIARGTWQIMYYASPDMDSVNKDLALAESLLGPDKQERIAYAQQGIQQMEKAKKEAGRPYVKGEQADLFAKRSQCVTIFGRLAHYYNVLADQTGDATARAMAAQYTQDLGTCAPQ